MAISQKEALELFIVGLRNIHGTARQCQSMVRAQEEKVESYPRIKEKLGEHLAEFSSP